MVRIRATSIALDKLRLMFMLQDTQGHQIFPQLLVPMIEFMIVDDAFISRLEPLSY
jgi:hypothetical protein